MVQYAEQENDIVGLELLRRCTVEISLNEFRPICILPARMQHVGLARLKTDVFNFRQIANGKPWAAADIDDAASRFHGGEPPKTILAWFFRSHDLLHELVNYGTAEDGIKVHVSCFGAATFFRTESDFPAPITSGASDLQLMSPLSKA